MKEAIVQALYEFPAPDGAQGGLHVLGLLASPLAIVIVGEISQPRARSQILGSRMSALESSTSWTNGGGKPR